MEKPYYIIHTIFTTVITWISAKIGILFPVLILLTCMMITDYFTGMIASKYEAIDDPNDPKTGWNSKKGAKGIMKKAGYLCVIAVALVTDYVILKVTAEMGMTINTKTFFGLLVSVWYLLNEMLSIVENAGRMGAPVPEWLGKYITVLKNKINEKTKESE